MDKMTAIELLVKQTVADELMQKDFAEIALRRGDAKFKAMVKCKILGDHIGEDSPNKLIADSVMKMNTQTIESVRGVLGKVDLGNSTTTAAVKNLSVKVDSVFSSLNKLSFVNTGLSGLNVGLSIANLAVSVKGFKEISNKLDNVSKQLNSIEISIEKLLNLGKNGIKKEYNSIKGKINHYYDNVRKNNNINIDTYEEFILEVNTFLKNVIDNMNDDTFGFDWLFEMLYSVIPAYTFLLNDFLKRYYYENHEFPTNLSSFMEVYDMILDLNKDNQLFDYLFLIKGMRITDAIDAVNIQELIVLNSKVQIEDYMSLYSAFDSEQKLCDFNRELDQIILDDVKEKIPLIAKDCSLNESECRKFIESLK